MLRVSTESKVAATENQNRLKIKAEETAEASYMHINVCTVKKEECILLTLSPCRVQLHAAGVGSRKPKDKHGWTRVQLCLLHTIADQTKAEVLQSVDHHHSNVGAHDAIRETIRTTEIVRGGEDRCVRRSDVQRSVENRRMEVQIKLYPPKNDAWLIADNVLTGGIKFLTVCQRALSLCASRANEAAKQRNQKERCRHYCCSVLC